jgi:undecaprenyl-diphosphatase
MMDIHKGSGAFYSILHGLNPVVNFLSNGATLIILALLIYLLGRLFNRRIYDTGKTLFVALMTSGIAVQTLKHLIGRARPRVTHDFLVIGPSLKGGYDSFPSGHTTLAFTLACVLSAYLPRYRMVFYSFAFITGFVRIEGTSHFPSDVLAGAILGLLIGRFVLFRSGKIDIKDHAVKQ